MSFMQSAAVSRIRLSPTMAASSLAAEMQAAGRDVISLSAGEPDMPTPAHIRAAGKKAINQGKTRYTAPDGTAELKAAICLKFRRDNGLKFTPSQVSVASGGKQVIFNALMATLNPGDEVIIGAPCWPSYVDAVQMLGGVPIIVATTPADGFRIGAVQLEAAITERTRWLILNSPSNPSGTVYLAGHLRALAGVLMRHPHVWCMCDDIYEHLLLDEDAFATMAAVEPQLADRTLTVNGVSKAWSMTGWRLGFAAGPEPLIAAMRVVQSQTASNPCTISQWAAIEAICGPQAFLTTNKRVFRSRRDCVVKWLAAAPGTRCAIPAGAFYVYPHIAGCIGKTSPAGTLINNDMGFSRALLEETGVAVVGGAAFGMSPYYRLSFAASDEALAEGCRRIRKFCEQLH